RIWEAATGKELRCLVSGRGAVTSLAFSADGKTLVSGHDSRSPAVHLWDVATGRRLRSFGGLRQATSVALSRDGRTVIAAGSTTGPRGGPSRKAWAVGTGDELPSSKGKDEESAWAVFSPDEKALAVAVGLGEVELRDAASGKALRTLPR